VPDITTIVSGLEAEHGRPHRRRRLAPLDELVACILSQHTSDVNSERAFTALKSRYRSWQAVLASPADELAETIWSGGLATQKAPRIQAVLAEVHRRDPRFTLEFLKRMRTPEARRWLMELPGIGPKCAAIVLCFAMGRPVLPVDTHVFRVSWRLGLVDRAVGEARAHDRLQAIVPRNLVFRFHVALIRHGRAVCKAQRPRCAACVLRRRCSYYRRRQRGRS
jgi:endonuclease-3